MTVFLIEREEEVMARYGNEKPRLAKRWRVVERAATLKAAKTRRTILEYAKGKKFRITEQEVKA